MEKYMKKNHNEFIKKADFIGFFSFIYEIIEKEYNYKMKGWNEYENRYLFTKHVESRFSRTL